MHVRGRFWQRTHTYQGTKWQKTEGHHEETIEGEDSQELQR